MPETTRKSWTYEDLVAEGLDPKHIEIVEGEPVEKNPVIFDGNRVGVRLATTLNPYVEDHGLGALYMGKRFLLRKDPRLERVPDISFISIKRLPQPEPPIFPGAPDLAVELLSPSDTMGGISTKADGYLEAGTSEIWLVNPALEIITVLRQGISSRSYNRGDSLESPDLLPGFSLDLDALFTLPERTPK